MTTEDTVRCLVHLRDLLHGKRARRHLADDVTGIITKLNSEKPLAVVKSVVGDDWGLTYYLPAIQIDQLKGKPVTVTISKRVDNEP